MPGDIIPQPDSDAIAGVIRERYSWLTRKGHETTFDELDEVVALQRLLMAHAVYKRQAEAERGAGIIRRAMELMRTGYGWSHALELARQERCHAVA